MKKLINTAEAAEYLGLRPNTLEIWRCRHQGPKYKKLGRRILYDPADLDEYAASCTVTTREKPSARARLDREHGVSGR